MTKGRAAAPAAAAAARAGEARPTLRGAQPKTRGARRTPDVAAGAGGLTILYGDFVGDVDFGAGVPPGPGTTYVAAFGAGGMPLWSRRFDVGTQNQQGMAEVNDVDASGEVVLTGAFGADVDFGGGPLEAQGGVGFEDGYVVKLDSNGNYLWSMFLAKVEER
jgi:hypothetical protein